METSRFAFLRRFTQELAKAQDKIQTEQIKTEFKDYEPTSQVPDLKKLHELAVLQAQREKADQFAVEAIENEVYMKDYLKNNSLEESQNEEKPLDPYSKYMPPTEAPEIEDVRSPKIPPLPPPQPQTITQAVQQVQFPQEQQSRYEWYQESSDEMEAEDNEKYYREHGSEFEAEENELYSQTHKEEEELSTENQPIQQDKGFTENIPIHTTEKNLPQVETISGERYYWQEDFQSEQEAEDNERYWRVNEPGFEAEQNEEYQETHIEELQPELPAQTLYNPIVPQPQNTELYEQQITPPGAPQSDYDAPRLAPQKPLPRPSSIPPVTINPSKTIASTRLQNDSIPSPISKFSHIEVPKYIPPVDLSKRQQRGGFMRPSSHEEIPDVKAGLQQLEEFIKDHSVTFINCQGPLKSLSIKRMGIPENTKICLDEKGIQQVIKEFSDASRIPAVEGTFKAVVEDLLITALINDEIGSRFTITRILH